MINKELDLLIHLGQRKIDQLSKYEFPIEVNNIVVVHELLYELAFKVQMKSSDDFPTAFDFIADLLESMLSNLDDDKKIVLHFLIDQFLILSSNKFSFNIPLK
ncbi:hypothetical protein NPIL_630141 [Nephila pilipes]|uniref:Uncharacterized protein n=1 Tax=Nephila pilipes TaxID=299642 RepID=A0A8X6ICB3_NEPPI|nr:hypothetical protein NPIL_630141 [Nephila pilipes]